MTEEATIQEIGVNELRGRLERVVLSLETIEAVLVLAGEVLTQQAASYDPEIALVLMRCASDPLHDELSELRLMIESIPAPEESGSVAGDSGDASSSEVGHETGDE